MVKTRVMAEKESQFEKLFALMEKFSREMNQNQEKLYQQQEKFREEINQKQDALVNEISKKVDRFIKKMDKNEKVQVAENLDESKSKVDVPLIAKPDIEIVTCGGKTSEEAGTNQFAIVAKTNGRDSITIARERDWDHGKLHPPYDILDGFTPNKPSLPDVPNTQIRLEGLNELSRERNYTALEKMKPKHKVHGCQDGELFRSPRRREGLSAKLNSSSKCADAALKRLNDVSTSIDECSLSKPRFLWHDWLAHLYGDVT